MRCDHVPVCVIVCMLQPCMYWYARMVCNLVSVSHTQFVCLLQPCTACTYVSMACVHAATNHVLVRMSVWYVCMLAAAIMYWHVCVHAAIMHVLVHIIARYLDGQGKIIMHAMQCSGSIFMRF